MRMYLSSYRLGNHTDRFQALVGKPDARVAVSVNALDGAERSVRNDIVLRRELEDMQSLGFMAEELDLREYFDRDDLVEKMKEYDAVWFSGGNTFLLIRAFKQSGFDQVAEQLIKSGELVYSGYSAAFCALSPSLKGVEFVDDKNAIAEGYKDSEVWDGLGLIDFLPIVHFRSNHRESELVEKEYEHVCKTGINHKTFKDGDAYVVDGDRQEVLSD